MNKASGKLNTAAELAFCFFASVTIAAAALNLGLNTEPGKILPSALSMRNGEMGANILRGIDLALADIDLIRSGNAASELWRLLTFVHLDLFFYLALLLPKAAAKTILLAGYYCRFGFCCASMYYFQSKHLKLSRLFSVLLSLMYAFSSQIIFTAQFASVMNMAVMMPVVMSSFDSYLHKRTWKSFVFVCLSSFGLAVTGGFGIISGIPAMIFVGLLMCISLYRKSVSAFVSWLKIMGGFITGIAMSMVFVLPGLLSMKIDVNVADSFKNAKVNYTFFELIRGTFLLRSGSIYQNTPPLFYVGILTLVAVIAFALNENIPVRLKVASAVIATVFHITCCSSFVNETISIFGVSPVLNSSMLIRLEIVLFFVAGIGLKNIKGLKRGDYIASCLIPLFFLVMSGNSTSGTSFASPIVISTFFGIILESALVYAYAKDKISETAKKVVVLMAVFFVCVNTAFIMFNNTIQKKAAEEYFNAGYGNSFSENLICDKDLELPLVNGWDKYLIVPSDLSVYMPGDSIVDTINYLSLQKSGEWLFDEIFLKPADKREIMPDGVNTFRLTDGSNEISFKPFVIEPGEKMFIYCNAANGAAVKIITPDGDPGKAFTGPFITAIDSVPGEVTLNLMIESEAEDECRISVFRLNREALEALNSASGEVKSSEFLIDCKDLYDKCTLILPYAYDDSKIKINGSAGNTCEFCGKLAVIFDGDAYDTIKVSIESNASGFVPGVLISAFATICIIAIPIFQLYNKKKKVTGEGTDLNA